MTFVPCGRIFGLVVIEGITCSGRTKLSKALAKEAATLGFLVQEYEAPEASFDSFDSISEYINYQFWIYRKACNAMMKGQAQLIFLDGWFYTARAHTELAYDEGVICKEEYDSLLFLMNTLLALQPWMPEIIVTLEESITRCIKNSQKEPWVCQPERKELMKERAFVHRFNLLLGESFETSSGTQEHALSEIHKSVRFQDVLKLLCPKSPELRPTRLDPRFTMMLENKSCLTNHVKLHQITYREQGSLLRAHTGDGKSALKVILDSIVYKVPAHNSYAHLLTRNQEVLDLLFSGDHRMLQELSSHYF